MNFSEVIPVYFQRHFAICAASFSISTLVLQKWQRFKHKRRFSQVNKHKIRSKSFHTQILCYGMSEMQKKTTVMTCRKYH